MRKRRLDLGLLQREVAEEIGVTESTIWNWEANHSSPQPRFIPKVISFLDYDPHSISSGSHGERLVSCRRSVGLSQRHLAYHLGFDPGTLARWERGDSQPSGNLLGRIEAILDSFPSRAAEADPAQDGRDHD